MPRRLYPALGSEAVVDTVVMSKEGTGEAEFYFELLDAAAK